MTNSESRSNLVWGVGFRVDFEQISNKKFSKILKEDTDDPNITAAKAHGPAHLTRCGERSCAIWSEATARSVPKAIAARRARRRSRGKAAGHRAARSLHQSGSVPDAVARGSDSCSLSLLESFSLESSSTTCTGSFAPNFSAS